MNLSRAQKGIVVAALHLAIISSLGAKLLHDRYTRPRVWVKTVAYDPDMLVRGRYIRLQLEVEARGFSPAETTHNGQYEYTNLYSEAHLRVESDKLIAEHATDNDYGDSVGVSLLNMSDTSRVRLNQSVEFFIPEHAQDPSQRPAGEELWVEVTIPKKGPPRPIQLGIRKNDGPIQPFEVHQ